MGSKQNEIPIKLSVDSSALDRIDNVAAKFPDEITTKLAVSDAELKTAVGLAADLDTTITTKVNVEDSDLNTAKRTVSDIGSATPNVKVTAEDSELDAVKEKLDQIRDLAIVNIVMNFDAAQVADIPILGTLIEIDSLTKQITGRVGKEIPGAAGIINSLYVQAWGDSKQQITDLIVELDRAGVVTSDLEKTATDVFEAAAVSGEDPIEIFRRMDTLVKNNLVPTFSEAADFIAGGFQTGLGRGADFLDTLDEYSQVLADNGLSAAGFFEILNAGQDAGVRNTDKLADAYKEMFNLTREEVGRFGEFGETTDRTQAIQRLGLMDEAEAFAQGKLTGDEWAAGLLDGLRAIEDPEEQRIRALAIFSPTMVEDVGLPGLLAADLNSSEVGDAWQGAADTGAAAINETIGTAITELQRTIETELATTLDETFDLSGRLDTARAQFQTFVDELQGGETLGGAIEIAFGIEGVDAALANIQRVFGQFVLSVLEVVAALQDPLGITENDAATRAEIARLAGQQLAFDLKVANEDEVGAIISQAAARGVDVQGLGGAVETALNELFASGDFAQGLNLIGGLNKAAAENGGDPAAAQALMDKYAEQLNTAFDDAIASGDFDLAKKISEAQNDPTAYTDALKGKFGFDAADFDQMAADFAAGMETSIAKESWWDDLKPPVEFSTDLDTAKTAVTNFGTDTGTAMENAALVTSMATDEMLLVLKTIEDGFISAEEKAALMDAGIEESLIGNTVTASFEAVRLSAEENIPIVINWFGQATESVLEFDRAAMGLQSVGGVLASLSSALDNFDLAKLQAIQAAANGGVPSGGGGGDTTNNINVNQTNNVSNGAQAAATTYDIAATIRPGG